MKSRRVNGGRIHLHIFVEVDRLVVNIVLHEKIINAGQQGHLRQGENVHELFHALAVGTLKRTFIVCYTDLRMHKQTSVVSEVSVRITLP